MQNSTLARHVILKWILMLSLLSTLFFAGCSEMKETRFRDPGASSFVENRDFMDESLLDNKDGDLLFSVVFRHDFNPNDVGVGFILISPNKDLNMSISHTRLLSDGFQLETELNVDVELTNEVYNSEIYSQAIYAFEKIPERQVDQLRKNITLEIDYILDGISKTKAIQIERYQYFPVPL